MTEQLRVVFDGAPSSGKSTLLQAIRHLGFCVIPEMARQVIEDGHFHPLKAPMEFRREVLARQIAAESRLDGSPSAAFLDRGAYAGEAYCLANGDPIPSFLADLDGARYDVMFLLDPLPWTEDGIRYEDPEFAYKINPIMERVYRKNGIDVVRIGVAPVAQRLQMIFGALGARGYTLET